MSGIRFWHPFHQPMFLAHCIEHSERQEPENFDRVGVSTTPYQGEIYGAARGDEGQLHRC